MALEYKNELAQQFKAVVKGRNFMTEQVLGYVSIKDGVAEISSGMFIGKKLYGATVVVNGACDDNLCKSFSNMEELEAYIEELNGKPKREPIQFTRISNDGNGNPRYVCDFYALLTRDESANLPYDQKYPAAIRRANKIGGRKYHTKSYGGGIVFPSYNIRETEQQIWDLLEQESK